MATEEGKAPPYYCHTTKPLHKAMVSWNRTQERNFFLVFFKKNIALLPFDTKKLRNLFLHEIVVPFSPSLCLLRPCEEEEKGGGGDNPVTGWEGWECVW